MLSEEEQILQEAGLTNVEAKIYLALSRENLTVWELSKRTSISRSTLYTKINELLAKGIITRVYCDKIRFKALDPEVLVRINEERTLKVRENLDKIRFWSSDESTVEVAEGLTAFKEFLNNLLKKNEEILVYGIHKDVPKILRGYIDKFHKIRIEKGIVMKHIYDYDALERIRALNKLKFTEARTIASLKTKSTTNICGDEVLITSWGEGLRGKTITIRILSREVSDTYKSYFNRLWQVAKR